MWRQVLNKVLIKVEEKYFFLYFCPYNLFENNDSKFGHKLAIMFLSFINTVIFIFSSLPFYLFFDFPLALSYFYIIPIIPLYFMLLINSKVFRSILFRQQLVNRFSKLYANSSIPKLVAILAFVFMYLYSILMATIINLLR